jgi:predicted metal-dependent hydrolase
LDYSERFIRPLFQKWLKKMNLTNVNLNFRWMVSRYGVCKTTKPYRVTLGLQSITNRIEVIEYLIVHELVHIFHHNHQQGFWNCVATYLPNWKSLDKELLKNNLEYLNLGNEK